MSDMPKPRLFSKAEIKEIESLFSRYLFYETLPSGNRHVECTNCNKDFIVGFNRTMTAEEDELWRARHNDYAVCPHCHKTAQVKSIGKSKSCKNLYEQQRVVVIQRVNENLVYAQAKIAAKSYSEYNHRPKVAFLEYNQSLYVFRPGKAVQYHKDYYNGFYQRKVAAEPFNKATSWYYNIPDNSYTVIGLNCLKDTFLRYNMLAEYADHCEELAQRRGYSVVEVSYMKYLSRFCEYPQIEILQKMGYYSVIKNLVEVGIKSHPYVNWKAKSLPEFFKMSKQDFKAFRELGDDLDFLKMKGDLSKITGNDSMQFALKYSKMMEAKHKQGYLMTVNENCPVTIPLLDKLEYIYKQACKRNVNVVSIKIEWFDYLSMAKKLKYDLTDPVVVFPKHLKRHHDLAVEVYNAKKAEEEAKKNAEKEKAAKKYIAKYKKLYCFSDDKYLIMVPETTAEIIAEGKEQHHCVGGYAARHLEGKLTICFLRSTAEPDKALYTIEMRGTKMTQVQGYGNKTPLTPEAKEFFDTWLKWVEDGSKRDRHGNPKILQTKTT